MKIFTFFLAIFLCASAQAQNNEDVYSVNPWVSGGITAAGAAASLIALPSTFGKPNIIDSEFTALNRKNVCGFDSWALDQTIPTDRHSYKWYAAGMQVFSAVLPLSLAFDKRIKPDLFDLFLMYLEVNAITVAIYQVSPIGPLFQDRYRPIVYYDELMHEEREDGYNRNSFFSGHVASSAASTYFMAKVYSDYHPEIGMNKYLLYGIAAIPPLFMGYLRLRELMHFPSDILVGFAIGTVCGILIPEIHRLAVKHFPSALTSSSISPGWRFGIAKEGENWNIFLR